LYTERRIEFRRNSFAFPTKSYPRRFRGKIGAPAWVSNNDGVIFGDKDYGAALILDDSLINARFTHRLSGADVKLVYGPTLHRDDFETVLSIDRFEVRGEGV
jgi:TLD